jgi:hypothetical protein
LLNHDGYGEFKKKFKINCVTRAYITISILYRMALGFYMAMGNEQEYQSLLILAISLAYLMFNIINLPFIDAYPKLQGQSVPRHPAYNFIRLQFLFLHEGQRILRSQESPLHSSPSRNWNGCFLYNCLRDLSYFMRATNLSNQSAKIRK